MGYLYEDFAKERGNFKWQHRPGMEDTNLECIVCVALKEIPEDIPEHIAEDARQQLYDDEWNCCEDWE